MEIVIRQVVKIVNILTTMPALIISDDLNFAAANTMELQGVPTGIMKA